ATIWYPIKLEDLVQYDSQAIAPQCHMAFVPEHVVIDLNDRRARTKSPPAWGAIYPKGGTVDAHVPAAPPQRDGGAKEQQEAAAVVVKRVLEPDVQKKLVARGFRPALAGVDLVAPFDKGWGVNPKAKVDRDKMPPVELALDCQDVWQKAVALNPSEMIK